MPTLQESDLCLDNPFRKGTIAWNEFIEDLRAVTTEHSNLSLEEYAKKLRAFKYNSAQATALAVISRDYLLAKGENEPLCQAKAQTKRGVRKGELEAVLKVMPNRLTKWPRDETLPIQTDSEYKPEEHHNDGHTFRVGRFSTTKLSKG